MRSNGILSGSTPIAFLQASPIAHPRSGRAGTMTAAGDRQRAPLAARPRCADAARARLRRRYHASLLSLVAPAGTPAAHHRQAQRGVRADSAAWPAFFESKNMIDLGLEPILRTDPPISRAISQAEPRGRRACSSRRRGSSRNRGDRRWQRGCDRGAAHLRAPRLARWSARSAPMAWRRSAGPLRTSAGRRTGRRLDRRLLPHHRRAHAVRHALGGR